MKYEIVFYHSRKTSETERLLARKLKPLGAECSRTVAAVSPEELAEMLGESLRGSKLVFVIGGLDEGNQSTDRILSLILSAKSDTLHSEKLLDDDDNIGYRLWAKGQTIVVFPDEPEIMETMLNKYILQTLQKDYELTQESSDMPSMESVADELKEQLSKMDSHRTFVGNQAMMQEEKALKRQKWLMIALAAAGVLLLAASVWFWLF